MDLDVEYIELLKRKAERHIWSDDPKFGIDWSAGTTGNHSDDCYAIGTGHGEIQMARDILNHLKIGFEIEKFWK